MSTDVLVVIGAMAVGEAIIRRSGTERTALLADSDESQLAKRAAALSTDGFAVQTHPVDVSSATSMVALAERAASIGVVSTAVYIARTPSSRVRADDILRASVTGVANFLDAFGPVIAPHGAGVVIDRAVTNPERDVLSAQEEAALSSTPAAQILNLSFLQQLSDPDVARAIAKRSNQLRIKTASEIWGARGARVNSISASAPPTPVRRPGPGANNQTGTRDRTLTTSGRSDAVSEIVAAAAFLTSPDAAHITGTDLRVESQTTARTRHPLPSGLASPDGETKPDSARSADQLANPLKERIYITFASLAVVLAIASHAVDTTPAEAMATLLISVSGTVLAGLVAELIAHLVAHQRLPNSIEFHDTLQASVSGAAAIVAPLGLIALAWAGLWSLDNALRACIAALIISLIAFGYLAIRHVRLPLWQRLTIVAAEALLGIAVIGLETLAHG